MQKLILMSVLLFMIVLPAVAAGEADARLGVKRAVWWTAAGIVVYVGLVLFIYPRFVG